MAAASSFASQMPSPEVPNVVREALGRSKTVAAGIQTFASLAAQGIIFISFFGLLYIIHLFTMNTICKIHQDLDLRESNEKGKKLVDF